MIKDLVREKPKNLNAKLKFNLPLPPSVNHMYIRLRGGRIKLTRKAEDYIRDARAQINVAVEEKNWIKQEGKVWYYIDLVFFMPDRKIRDSHNMLKPLMDVMQGIVFDNDYTVMPRIQSVEYDKENPRVEVFIFPQSVSNRNKGLKVVDGN